MRLISLFALLSIASPAAAQSAPAADKAAVVPALERVVVLGASLSDGIGLEQKEEVGARTTFADLLDAGLRAEHKPVGCQASTWLFMNTVPNGMQLAAAAHAAEPTLVVALDFLFWYGYGAVGSEPERLALLEKGLKELETFACPTLVGDFPDMSQALQGKSPLTGGGPVISKEQIPEPATLKQLNERVAAWAEDRPNVTLVPLGELVARMRANEEIVVRENRWPAGSASSLMQADLLHPTLRGSIAVWLFAADRLVAARPEFPAEAFEWDAETIRSKAYAAKEKERLAAAERERKRKAKHSPPPEPVPEPTPTVKRRRSEQGEDGGQVFEPEAFVPLGAR